MGREIKRVAADFDWPLWQVWEGYLNPHEQHCHSCETCGGSCYNPWTRLLRDAWYGVGNPLLMWQYDLTQHEVDALVTRGRLKEFTHIFSSGEGWRAITPRPVVTAEQINAWSRSRGAWAFDAVDVSVCVRARAERWGVYGLCDQCAGEGHFWRSPKDKQAAEAWKPTDPPPGTAYQVWETVSEGSPVSPPFLSPPDLAQWLVENDASATCDVDYTQWLDFILRGGCSVSIVADGRGGVRSGVAAESESRSEAKRDG